jgi:hypothetical protein
MPVPASLADLSTTAASNSPPGTEAILPNLDDYLRFFASCIALLRDGASFTDNVRLEGATQGTLGVMQGAGSGGTANVVADDIVIDGDANAGLTILSGTANAGNVIFGDSGSATQGRLRYDHSIDELSLWVNGTQYVTLTSAGRFILSDGTSVSYSAGGGVTPDMQMHGTAQGDASLGLYSWSTDAATDPTLAFSKSKSGTVGTRGAVSNGDELGTIAFGGDDGTAFIRGARIRAVVDAAPGTNDMPARLEFYTTPNASDTPALAFTVNSSQQAIFSGDVLLEVAGATIGYKSGSGATVTQTTSKSNPVTLNSATGQITTHSASIAASTAVSFTFTNSTIDGSDLVLVNISGGATINTYAANVTSIGSGTARIQIANLTTSASPSDTLVLNFAVIKGANA